MDAARDLDVTRKPRAVHGCQGSPPEVSDVSQGCVEEARHKVAEPDKTRADVGVLPAPARIIIQGGVSFIAQEHHACTCILFSRPFLLMVVVGVGVLFNPARGPPQKWST